MCVPALALLAVLCYIPFGGAWMAFTKFNVVDGIFGSPFAGLDNFVMFFEIGAAARVIYNTLFINVFGIILGLVFPISLAISLNEIQKGVFKRVTQGVMFFPYFLSWVVVGAIAYGLFSTDVGVVNAFLRDLGAQPIRWYAEPKYWKGFLIAFEVWKWSGYSSIIYLAAMANFDPNLFEAAEVDGASKWQRIVHLTIPMLRPTAVVLTLMSIGRIFYGDFGMVYGIVGTNPVLSSEVEVIDIHVYGSMRALGFSYATAVGLMQSVMGLIMVTLSNRLAKRLNEGEGLF
jgi:multiple sugar transport system permease protein/putative aldouronate transport system permease protein